MSKCMESNKIWMDSRIFANGKIQLKLFGEVGEILVVGDPDILQCVIQLAYYTPT